MADLVFSSVTDVSAGGTLSTSPSLTTSSVKRQYISYISFNMTPYSSNVGSKFNYKLSLSNDSSQYLSETGVKKSSSGVYRNLDIGKYYESGTIYAVLNNTSSGAMIDQCQVLMGYTTEYRAGVKFDFNGGMCGECNNEEPHTEYGPWTETSGLSGTITLNKKPYKDGYKLAGWTKNSGTTIVVSNTTLKFPVTAGSFITYYAAWEKIITYPVKYYDNNIQIGSQEKIQGENLTLFSTPSDKTGYEFFGWNTKEDGSGDFYAPGDIYTSDAALTLYAQWTPIRIKVIYNGNGGFLENGNIVLEEFVNYGDSVNLTSQNDKKFKKTGYNFVGWGTHLAATAPPSNNKEIKQETQLYAIWELGSNIRIFTNGKWEIALPYIYKNAQWQLTISKVFNNGEWRQ